MKHRLLVWLLALLSPLAHACPDALRLGAIPEITQIITTDTVFIPPEKRHPKLKILPVGRVFGEAIRRNYLHRSIGDLFVYGEGG